MENNQSQELDPRVVHLRLLQAGVTSYLEALTALAEYRRVVRSRCEEALRRGWPELGTVWGLNLAQYHIDDWHRSDAKPDPTFAVIGVQQEGLTLTGEANNCGSYFGLVWDRTTVDPWFGACAVMRFNRGKDCRNFFLQMRSLNERSQFELIEDEWNQIWYSSKLTPDDMVCLDQKLDELLTAWAHLWRRTGLRSGTPCS